MRISDWSSDVCSSDLDEPSREKTRALKDYLDTIGLSFPLGEVLKPALFNRVLARARDAGQVEEVSQAVLRTQAQAVYSTTNIGRSEERRVGKESRFRVGSQGGRSQ